jgi:hypothetical protein
LASYFSLIASKENYPKEAALPRQSSPEVSFSSLIFRLAFLGSTENSAHPVRGPVGVRRAISSVILTSNQKQHARQQFNP